MQPSGVPWEGLLREPSWAAQLADGFLGFHEVQQAEWCRRTGQSPKFTCPFISYQLWVWVKPLQFTEAV